MKKGVGVPEFLFSLEESWGKEADEFCLWLCSGCGAPYHFRKRDGKHGRPPLIPGAGYVPFDTGKPEYVGFVGPCWRSSTYKLKCVTPRGGRVLYHEGFDKPTEEMISEVTRVASSQRKEEQKLDKARRAATVTV